MFHKTLQETTWQMDRNTVAIWTTAHLQYLLITVKVAFSDIQNPNTVCEYINCRWQALFAQKRQFNATNSDASISVRKIFFGFFFAFFRKRWPSFLMYFRKYRLWKTWLVRCLTSRVTEHPSTDKMVNGSKHCLNLNESASTIFINNCEGNCVGNSSF